MATPELNIPLDLLKKYDKAGPRYTSYPTAPTWSEDITPDDYIEALKNASSRPEEPLSLYIHVPFCQRRCYYCGCNTVVTNNMFRIVRYVETMKSEINRTAELLGKRRLVSQLHFGGGTPTIIDVAGLGATLDCLSDNFTFTPECEISIEIDPRVTTGEQLEFLAHRGFNRISMGVQDFDEEVQKACGRIQPFEMVQETLNNCRRVGFKGINFDFIYGLPCQNVERFSRTLDLAVELRPDRVAVYSFAYLPSLKANQRKIHPEDLPVTEVKFELFATAIRKFTAAGYCQIGMDHFAMPQDELTLAQKEGRLHRNFMGYTVQSATDMIGLGMSSIGYVDNTFYQNQAKLDSYERPIKEGTFAICRGKKLSDDDLVRQFVITSLMCNFRLDFAELKLRFGVEYLDYFHKEYPELDGFINDGILTNDEFGLTVTPLGRTFVRNIAMIFDAYLGGDKRQTFSRTI